MKPTNEVIDAAAVKHDIPAEPTALVDEDWDKVAAGGNTIGSTDVAVASQMRRSGPPGLDR